MNTDASNMFLFHCGTIMAMLQREDVKEFLVELGLESGSVEVHAELTHALAEIYRALTRNYPTAP